MIKNLIFLFLTFIITSQSCFCYTLTSSELSQNITKKLETETYQKLKLNKNEAEVKINVSNIPFSTIETTSKNYKVEINQVSLVQPNTFRRIIIKNQDNTIAKSFNATVKTSVLKEVLVAKENINFNSAINQNNAEIKKVDILKNYNKVLNNFENNLIAKRNYQKGNVILRDYSGQKAEVTKNSLVDILFITNGIKIKLQGTAMKDGNIGDTILVRSDKYNKIYNAKVNSSNEVVVKI